MAKLSKEDIRLANKIADRIKQLRISSTGDIQADFAKKHGLDKQLVSRWESHIKIDPKSGKNKGRGLTIYTIEKFCELLDISLSDFFDDDLFQ